MSDAPPCRFPAALKSPGLRVLPLALALASGGLTMNSISAAEKPAPAKRIIHRPEYNPVRPESLRGPSGQPLGMELWTTVKKLAQVDSQSETALSPRQAQEVSDLLEPLFESKTLNPQEAKTLLRTLREALTPAQAAAFDAAKVAAPAMPPPNFPPGGGPGGGPPPGGGPGGPGGGPPPMDMARMNPFFSDDRNPMSEGASHDLRTLLDSLEKRVPPEVSRPASIDLADSDKIAVTTFHYDLARTGWNKKEKVLTPQTVNKDHFGKRWYSKLDGQVYAAPLVVPGMTLAGGSHDVVFAPTENNTVYALDANTGDTLWKQHLARPLDDHEYNDCINITPLHGITSTPVIDLDRKEIYVCGLTLNKLRQVYKIWALDLNTGAVKTGWPVTLQGEYRKLKFDGGENTQRSAITEVDGWLYIPFASRCDIGDWHGWVFGVNAANPDAPQRVFSPAPDASGGGMWGSAGLSSDGNGNLFGVTGNGDYNLNKAGHSVVEAMFRLGTKDGLTFSYDKKDYYVPSNFAELDAADADLGGSSAIVIDHPESATPHLLLTGGKDGFVYLADRDNLGGVGGEIQKERIFGGGGGRYGSFIKTTPAYYEDGKGTRYIFITGNDEGAGGTRGVVAMKLGLDAKKRSHFTPVWSANRPLYQPGTAVVSSNGSEDALVWVIESNKDDDNNGPPGILHAFDVATGKEVYHTYQRERRDSLGDARKFSAPTVANGMVYCGTDGVVAYGPIVTE